MLSYEEFKAQYVQTDEYKKRSEEVEKTCPRHFVDEEFARWSTRHNMKWLDSNIFCSDEVTSLSNCCFDADTCITYYRDDQQFETTFGDYVSSHIRPEMLNIPSKVTETVQGDYILGPDGSRIEIVAVGKLPNYSRKLIDIELEDGRHLRVTPDQRIWDNNSQSLVFAKDILANPNKYDI